MAETPIKTTAAKPTKTTREQKKEQKQALKTTKQCLFNLAFAGGDQSQPLQDAVSIFSTLTAKNQEKILKMSGNHLRSCANRSGFRQASISRVDMAWNSTFASEVQYDIRTASRFTAFLTGIASALPHDNMGDIIVTKQLQRIYSSLVKIADSLPYANQAHVDARKAASSTLWQLDYGYLPFWEARLEDQTTRADTITKLLGMGSGDGWNLLKSHLGECYVDIARSNSPHVHDFLLDAINDMNPGVQCNAFRAAAYLPTVQPAIFDIAQRMQLPPEDAAAKLAVDTKMQANPTLIPVPGSKPIECSTEVKQAARDFLFVNQARQLIDAGEEYAGTFALTTLYMDGRTWLRPMLEEMCADATSRAKVEAGLTGILAGLSTPIPVDGATGQTIVPARTILGVLGMAGIKVPAGVLASDGIRISREIGQTAWDIIDSLPALNIDSRTGEYAQDGSAPVRGSCVRVWERTSGDKWKVQFKPAEETALVTDLITIHSALANGSEMKAEVESLLQTVGMKMADAVVNPSGSSPESRAAARQKARDTLNTITEAGICVPYSDFLDDSIALTLNSAKPIPKEVVKMAASATATTSVFVASIYFDSVPAEVLDFAHAVNASEFDAATKQMAADVIFISEAKEMLKQEGPAAFAGTFALTMLYSAERPALTHMLGGMLVDALNAPVEKIESASNTLRLMQTCGIQPTYTKDDKTTAVPIPNPFKQLPRDIVLHAIDMRPEQCVLYAGAFLSRTPTELTEYANSLASGPESPTSIAAKDFLAITEAMDLINCGNDQKQIEGVNKLIALYKDRKDIAPLLFEAGVQMADLVMDPPCGEPAQRNMGWDMLLKIESAGIDLTYQKLLAAPYLDQMPETVVASAEALLVHEHINEAVKGAARDLLVLKDAKAKLATADPALYALTLSTLYHTGSPHIKDLVESTGNEVVLELVTTTDVLARQKALRTLGSLYDINVSGDVFFAEALESEIRPEMLGCAKDIVTGVYSPGLKLAAEDLIAVHAAMEQLKDETRQFEGANALIGRYDVGRTSLANILYDGVAKQMVPLLASTATTEQQDAAAGVISLLYERKPDLIEPSLVAVGTTALEELASKTGNAAAAAHVLVNIKKILGEEKLKEALPGVGDLLLQPSVLIEDRTALGYGALEEGGARTEKPGSSHISGGVSDAA